MLLMLNARASMVFSNPYGNRADGRFRIGDFSGAAAFIKLHSVKIESGLRPCKTKREEQESEQ